MERIRAKVPTRRVLVMIGVVVAFFAIAAPSCRDYNGGGPTNAAYVLRVSPAVVCRDGMYVVFVRELRDQGIFGWDGGNDDRVTVFRGSPAQFQDDAVPPLPVIADQTLDFTVVDDPAVFWPEFVPRYPDVGAVVDQAFSAVAVKLPWQGGVRLAIGEEIVGQTYTDEFLSVGVPFQPPPVGRGPLGPTEIIRPTDPYFDLDPEAVPYSRVARIFPGRQAEGYPTFEDPADVDEQDPAAAADCWMSPKTATVDVRPGTTPNAVDPASATPVPVAVLSTPGLDASQIAPAWLRIGTAAHSSFVKTDVDSDGDIDVLASFVPNQSGLQCGSTSIRVRGALNDGPPFSGTDSVVTAPCA